MIDITPPCFVVMVGLPGSGKSTFIKDFSKHTSSSVNRMCVISFDDYIEAAAKAGNKTYNEAFPDHAKAANKYIFNLKKLYLSIWNQFNNFCDGIIWDQTNLSAKKRKSVLQDIPENWKKIAILVSPPDDYEWYRRLDSRPGKTIPNHVLQQMVKSAEVPSIEEGFDRIFVYKDGVINEL